MGYRRWKSFKNHANMLMQLHGTTRGREAKGKAKARDRQSWITRPVAFKFEKEPGKD